MKTSYIILILALSVYTVSVTAAECEIMVVSPTGYTNTVKIAANGKGYKIAAGQDGFIAFAVFTQKCECTVNVINKVQEKGVPAKSTINTSRLPTRLGKTYRTPFVAAHLIFGCHYY